MASWVESVQQFRKLRALVIGDVMLDSYLIGVASRISPEAPVPVVRKTSEERAPGGAANTAANLRALGATVRLIGITGADTPAQSLRSTLHDLDIETEYLVSDPAATTLHKLRIVAGDQYVVRLDEGDTLHCSPATHKRLLAHLQSAFRECDLIVVSDYCYGVVSEAVVMALRHLRSRRPCVLVIDSKQPRKFARAAATVLAPNLREAQLAVAGVSSEVATDTDAQSLGPALLGLTDAEYVAITMASDGVLLTGRLGQTEHLPAHPVAHAHVIGAGDSFTSAMALALAAGAAVTDAAQIGIEAASVAVSRRRTAIVYNQELLARVSLREYSTGLGGHALDTARLGFLPGLRIVFTNGIFDVLNAGHLEFLRQARELGDVLVVGVNSDASVSRLTGRAAAMNNERDRLALVAALDPVDHAVLFHEPTPSELIRRLRPHIHAKGGDYASEALPEDEAVREVGGRTVILPLVGAHDVALETYPEVRTVSSGDGL